MTMTTSNPRKRQRPTKRVQAPAAVTRRRPRPTASAAKTHSQRLSFDDKPVGYCRPPADTQFRKGQSGNPKGRPKNSRNVKTSVRELANRRFEVVENGKRRKMSMIDLMLHKLTEKALASDLPAIRKMLELFAEHLAEEVMAEQPRNSPEEVALLAQIFGYSDGLGEDEEVGVTVIQTA